MCQIRLQLPVFPRVSLMPMPTWALSIKKSERSCSAALRAKARPPRRSAAVVAKRLEAPSISSPPSIPTCGAVRRPVRRGGRSAARQDLGKKMAGIVLPAPFPRARHSVLGTTRPLCAAPPRAEWWCRPINARRRPSRVPTRRRGGPAANL